MSGAATLVGLAFVVFCLASQAGRAGGSVTVTNVPPEFRGVDIHTANGLNYVDVVVSDYNSWHDIFTVRVEVLDQSARVESSVVYQQYATNTTLVATPSFSQPVGNYFVSSLSSANAAENGVTIPERTELRLTFVLSPIKGQWLNVTATDLGGLSSYAQVEYQGGLVGSLPLVGAWVIATVAAVFAVAVVARRVRRDHHGD